MQLLALGHSLGQSLVTTDYAPMPFVAILAQKRRTLRSESLDAVAVEIVLIDANIFQICRVPLCHHSLHEAHFVLSRGLFKGHLRELIHAGIAATRHNPLLDELLELPKEEAVRLAVDPVRPPQLPIDVDPALRASGPQLVPAVQGAVGLQSEALQVLPGGHVLAVDPICTASGSPTAHESPRLHHNTLYAMLLQAQRTGQTSQPSTDNDNIGMHRISGGDGDTLWRPS
mmetsp:Transcript_24874/g.70811  ORF Transcript_24874/g.70811 Transcript_24874/m.70811 type:complete len:229 (-) Transcript_24874:125-811(-)